jgi:serine/threonine protein phosphatase PrpC
MEATLQIKLAVRTDVGRVRAANEDNQGHAEYYWGQVFVVCDGMGGHVGGAKASTIAVNSILEFLARDDARDPAESLSKAIAFANEQIYATALNQRELKGMGTTCVALLQKETGLWLAHVGDSRAYIYTDGKLFKLSRDHSFVQRLVDQGTILEEDAESHPRKNELTRALGIAGEVEVEVAEVAIFPKKGDLFLLCSDGLYGMTGDTGIQKVLAGAGTLDEKAQLLIDEANESGGTDNITVQLIYVTDSPHVVNRYLPIKPPVNFARTSPVEQQVAASPAAAEPYVPFAKKYMIPLVFVITALLATATILIGDPFGWKGPSYEEKRVQDSLNAEKRKLEVEDSIAKVEQKREDSLALVKYHVADSMYNDSLKRKLKPKVKPEPPK